jgi:hypothetical protein
MHEASSPLGLNAATFTEILTRTATFFTFQQAFFQFSLCANQESAFARGDNTAKIKEGAGSGARNDCRLRTGMIAMPSPGSSIICTKKIKIILFQQKITEWSSRFKKHATTTQLNFELV